MKLPNKRWKLLFLALIVLIIIISIAAEVACRTLLGLGSPPLYVMDDKIEYMLKPSQEIKRFGYEQVINQWGMRTVDPLEEREAGLRALIVGDSICYAGSRVGQSNIAVAKLRQSLQQTGTWQSIEIGNASAGSWGPANQLAYLEKFGIFDSDVVIWVLSSHDFHDAPTFEPLGTNHPTELPPCALWELGERYLPRYLPFLKSSQTTGKNAKAPAPPQEQSIQELVELVRKAGIPLCVILHYEKKELTKKADELENMNLLRDTLNNLDVPVFEDRDSLSAAIGRGQNPYMDNIHLSAEGQPILARLMHEAVTQLLNEAK